MAQVTEQITDGRVLELIAKLPAQGVLDEMKGWEAEESELGTPQGGVISPLLANLYLHPLDVKMASQGWALVRYADDAVVPCRSQERGGDGPARHRRMGRGSRTEVTSGEDESRDG